MECVNEYYISDGNMLSCSEFNDDILRQGKTLYEVIRVIDGVPLFLERHLKRLKNSALITNLYIWVNDNDIRTSILKLIEYNNVKNGNVKLLFNFMKDDKKNKFDPNYYYAYFVKHHYPSQDDYKDGVSTILFHGERDNPNAKVINADFRKTVDEEIVKKRAYEAILVDRFGNITEGSKSNIFMIKNDYVVTAPLELILPGVTREVIIELCNNLHINVREEKVSYRDIGEMDAMFISGTSPKVLPIKSVDEIKFMSAENLVLNKIKQGYDDLIDSYINNYK